jgi:deazaflavin-dependent oxidoreductase (nitroreductase family)
MRLPEPLFVFINPVVKAVLRSPIHWLCSKSLMLITFRGRRSGKLYTTPVRYVRVGNTVRCFTTAESRWWRNLSGGADVTLRIAGANGRYHATPMEPDPSQIREALAHYLTLFPGDAVYHGVRLSSDGKLLSEDLDRASHEAIVVEAYPTQ